MVSVSVWSVCMDFVVSIDVVVANVSATINLLHCAPFRLIASAETMDSICFVVVRTPCVCLVECPSAFVQVADLLFVVDAVSVDVVMSPRSFRLHESADSVDFPESIYMMSGGFLWLIDFFEPRSQVYAVVEHHLIIVKIIVCMNN